MLITITAKKRTATYSNHCVEWYKKGLDELWSAGGYGGDVWQDYNGFRREMSLSVLDFVALFPNYDTHLYPIEISYYICGGVNRCSEQKYVNNRLELLNSLSSGSRSSDAHSFSVPIDTSKIDLNDNTGIWIAFKVATTDGYATFGNLELVEEGSLLGDTLERVQREDQQWKSQMIRKREEAERKYMADKQAIEFICRLSRSAIKSECRDYRYYSSAISRTVPAIRI
nr:insecticidal delta-endotoxin Cry8Ea1 family protein [Bacillus cereus]